MAQKSYKPLVYPAKIILAWGEAITGNTKIRNWLARNGYPELYAFVFALHLKEDSRKWLMINNFPHLLALIQGVEGNKTALNWLKNNNFTILWHMAMAGDNNEESLNWLLFNEKDFAMLALKIKNVKNEIQMNNDDPHRISGE
jgi:hypothetical protein